MPDSPHPIAAFLVLVIDHSSRVAEVRPLLNFTGSRDSVFAERSKSARRAAQIVEIRRISGNPASLPTIAKVQIGQPGAAAWRGFDASSSPSARLAAARFSPRDLIRN